MTHWLTIIGIGEGGTDDLTPAACAALRTAQVVMGPPRHLSMVPDTGVRRIEWPVPFADGIDTLLAQRGTPTVALASGDPFWFGAGSVLAARLERDEWTAHPGASAFSLAAARLGWPLERTICLGLHAAPLPRMRTQLHPGARLIVTLRDGSAVADLAGYLSDLGFGSSRLTVLERLGGPAERITETSPATLRGAFDAPVAAAITVAGSGTAIPLAAGRPDPIYAHDGQITKRPVRALTLSALAPQPGEHLWDIGGGSGSIALEWCMAHPTNRASVVERRPDRVDRIRANADALGQPLTVIEGAAPDALETLPRPDAIFVGGGLSAGLLDWLAPFTGTRLVVNAVTLETEALVLSRQAQIGGELLRVQMARPEPLGGFHGWQSSYPLLQWSVTL